MKKRLSPRVIKALKPGKDGVRRGDIVMDDHTSNLGVRVFGDEKRPRFTFVFIGRFPGYISSSRVAIGPFVCDPNDEDVAVDSLKRARAKAYQWRNAIAEGRDPRVEEKLQREAVALQRATTFGAVSEDFISHKLRREVTDGDRDAVSIDGGYWRYLERRGANVEREVRKEFKGWWSRPISDITDEDIVRLIRAKAKLAPASARNILGHAKRIFSWAVDQRTYGLKQSPATSIKPNAIVGKKLKRSRLLDDVETFAFMRAASKMPYPAGPTYQMLILTGLRLNEVAEARLSEFHPTVQRALRQRGDGAIDWKSFDIEHLVWTIPELRMKGRSDTARAHAVPLTVEMLQILEKLPDLPSGDYLFSRSGGKRPAIMSDLVKDDLDRRMLRTMRSLARKQGEDVAAVDLPPWVNHDLRRLVRSGLSRLKIADEVCEAILAHAPPGMRGIYDRHNYLSEKRDALELWAARLRSIVEPPRVTNVIALRG